MLSAIANDMLAGEDWEPRHVVPSRVCYDPPGSEEKLAELQRRVACGEPLWHPQDNNTLDPGMFS